MDKGISFLEDNKINLDYVKNTNQDLQKDYFTGNLSLLIGKTTKDKKEIHLNLNSNKYNNAHMAVAGSTGTGKTRFAFHLLSEISKVSNHKVNFIYLDFKGVKGEDVNRFTPFFEQTQTNFIDIPTTKFPINPLSFIDNINEVQKKMGIDKFTDIICKYSNLGVKQKGNLREATMNAFNEKKHGEYPTISEITEKLYEIIGEKLDSLTEIMNALSRYEIFKAQKEKHKSFLNENTYLSLSSDLPNPLRFTSLFLIINYIHNVFMNMEDTPVDENGFKAMRYVVLIDEAHVVFKEKKYQEILQTMLREIRSKGVSIIMLSQGLDEFNQPSFDFSEMCEISILLGIKDKNNRKAINKFMGVSEKEGIKVMRSLEKISKGEAIANIKEGIEGFSKGDLFDIKQFSS
ncbi:ATP-binding protein [Bernardetia litoralis]|uniref:ATP-binding protein n=1 Tax=Bernardetia litoralis TaxID=999 RepID=UPI0002FE9BE3|nr:ATP-binding protein [Bernardetia litoralis]